jgi:hypothetical protein
VLLMLLQTGDCIASMARVAEAELRRTEAKG